MFRCLSQPDRRVHGGTWRCQGRPLAQWATVLCPSLLCSAPPSTLLANGGGFVQANQETARRRQEIGNTSCFSERVALKFAAPICLATAICPAKRSGGKYEAAAQQSARARVTHVRHTNERTNRRIDGQTNIHTPRRKFITRLTIYIDSPELVLNSCASGVARRTSSGPRNEEANYSSMFFFVRSLLTLFSCK